jgi:hypothetical protein
MVYMNFAAKMGLSTNSRDNLWGEQYQEAYITIFHAPTFEAQAGQSLFSLFPSS